MRGLAAVSAPGAGVSRAGRAYDGGACATSVARPLARPGPAKSSAPVPRQRALHGRPRSDALRMRAPRVMSSPIATPQ
ncbi:hypothetical protein WT33_12330 [Burkholderia stagnalis]|nr:hypothetical protein WT33_12330 [Burkholderia stagnalis]